MPITYPVSEQMKLAVKSVMEGTQTKKTSDGGKLKVTVQNTKLQGNKFGYLSVTGEHTEHGHRNPSSFGMLHDTIKQEHKDGKYDLAMRYHLRTINPGKKEHGEPLHTLPNAYYHAGIGPMSKANASHLASHLDISNEDAQKTIDHIKTLPDLESKQKTINTLVDSHRHRWSKNMDKVMDDHSLKP